MKCVSIFVSLLVFGVTAYSQQYPCAPKGMDLRSQTVETSGKSIKVADKLRILKARCSHGHLIDRKNREIRMYKLQGCWGNPPADYEDTVEEQRKEIAALKEKYTVIQIACATDLRTVQ